MLGAPLEEAQKVMEELDVGRTGRISYTEFLAGVTDLRQRSPMERDKLLKLAWQQFGPDGRGMVKTGSVQAALAARGLTVAELPKEFLSQLRRGAAGEISFEVGGAEVFGGHGRTFGASSKPTSRTAVVSGPFEWSRGPAAS